MIFTQQQKRKLEYDICEDILQSLGVELYETIELAKIKGFILSEVQKYIKRSKQCIKQ